jgi:Xaa-Pro dipeptidase
MKIPDSILRARVKKVQEKLRKENLKALVVYSTGNVFGWAGRTHGYLRYLCNWDARNSASVLVLFPKKEPILLVPFHSFLLFARETVGLNDIRFVTLDNFDQEIVSIIKPLVSGRDKIGYIGKHETPAPLYEALVQGLTEIELVQVNRIIDELTMFKDELQITFHRRAAEICDAMFETFSREVRKGKKAYQLQADLEHAAKYEGCEYASTWLTIAPVADRARYVKEECSRVPQTGDQILLALFVMYEGHWGHAVRTGTLGSPNQAQSRVFNIVREMQEAALERLKPGLDLREVVKATESIRKKYYPNIKDLDGYRVIHGHSIGHHYKDPILSDALAFPNPSQKGDDLEGKKKLPPMPITTGMLFELHPNLFVKNEAAAMIGDMVLITETANERLTQFPREFIVW